MVCRAYRAQAACRLCSGPLPRTLRRLQRLLRLPAGDCSGTVTSTRLQCCSLHGRRPWLRPSSTAWGEVLLPDVLPIRPAVQLTKTETQCILKTPWRPADMYPSVIAACREASWSAPAPGADAKRETGAPAEHESDKPSLLLSHMVVGRSQPAPLGTALTAAVRRLHAARPRTRRQESFSVDAQAEIQHVRGEMAERMTKVLQHAATAPAGHWTGRSAAELAQCTIVVRSLAPSIGVACRHQASSWLQPGSPT